MRQAEAESGQGWFEAMLADLEQSKADLQGNLPEDWEAQQQHKALMNELAKAQRDYTRTVDGAYEQFAEIRNTPAGDG
ncbi:MAG: hypothetical protein R3E95_09950 [Thiolinea sp.]